MNQLPTPELLKQIAKEPKSVVIFLLTGLVWYFVFKWAGVSGEVSENCEKEKTALRQEVVIVRQQYNDLVIDDRERSDSMQRELTMKFDSLLRDRLEYKTKQNLKKDN